MGLVASCASGPQTRPEAAAPLTARSYYPLAVGNSWTYRASPAPEGADTRRIEILREEEGFFVDNNEPPARLQARSTGIFDGDRFLLEDPLEVGHAWMAIPTVSAVERYEIVATDLEVQTPAGHFLRCVRVKAEQEDASRGGPPVTLVVLWTYAPGVGLVSIEQRVRVGDKPAQRSLYIELIDYEVKPAEAKGT